MSNQTLLIRHAESIANTGDWRAFDSCLSEAGQQQAHHMSDLIITPPDLLVISSLKRTHETCQQILNKWPQTPIETWAIEEFHYLSRSKLKYFNDTERQDAITWYWNQADPHYRHGEDAESFAAFMQRVMNFQTQIFAIQGFKVVIGHGQFLKAVQLNQHKPYQPTSAWMSWFRQQETQQPMKNCEIYQLNC